MPLRDDLDFTVVEKDEYQLLLEGEGVITNMSLPGADLEYRIDIETPTAGKVRTLKGSYDQLSFTNYYEEVKVYGKANSKPVKLLITRQV